MNPNYIDCVQGTKEWFDCRLGCVTSSRIADVIVKLKRKEGESAARHNMRYELMCELLTKKATEHYVSRWMKEGKEREPLARVEYEIRNGITVEQVGFVYHSAIKMAGASPDGLVGADGLLEIKCPTIYTHLEYLEKGEIPEEYLPQLTWQLACDPDRQWNDFVSYHPDLPDHLQVFQKRLQRTEVVDATIRGMELEVEQINKEVQAMLAGLMGRNREALQEAIA